MELLQVPLQRTYNSSLFYITEVSIVGNIFQQTRIVHSRSFSCWRISAE